jgi:hypothetical protein
MTESISGCRDVAAHGLRPRASRRKRSFAGLARSLSRHLAFVIMSLHD